MEDGKRLALAVRLLVTALVLGVAGDLFLRDEGTGIGLTLFGVAVFAGATFVLWKSPEPISRGARFLGVLALGFSALFLWRDAPELKLLNATSVVLLVGAVALRSRTGNIRVASVLEYPFRLIEQWGRFLADAFPAVSLEGQWKGLMDGRNGKLFTSVGLGLLLATPLVLVFGGLFVSADAGFESLVNRAFRFDAESIWNHSFTIFIAAWLSAGFLYRIAMVREIQGPPKLAASKPSQLSIVEIGIVLGLLDLLFAAFVATQFRHLFGGNDVVRTTANLGYAQYARRGFFELSAVALLVLPVLLGAHAVLRRDNPRAERTFNLLASVLVGLVFLVIHSAVLRMRLYVDAYGISQLRIYVLASIAWIGAVFVWFVSTVVRGKPERFAFGGLMLFLTAVLGLNILNPDALVARVNTSRSQGSIDVAYLSSLSDDSAPVLAEVLGRLPAEAQSSVIATLNGQAKGLKERDWRNWTLSGMQAERALAGYGVSTRATQ